MPFITFAVAMKDIEAVYVDSRSNLNYLQLCTHDGNLHGLADTDEYEKVAPKCFITTTILHRDNYGEILKALKIDPVLLVSFWGTFYEKFIDKDLAQTFDVFSSRVFKMVKFFDKFSSRKICLVRCQNRNRKKTKNNEVSINEKMGSIL